MSDKITDKLIVVSEEDMAMVENNVLNVNQLAFLFRKTPAVHISKRPAKGGGEWSYVTGTYVKKVLNLMFGWDWDFEIVDEKFDLNIGQAYVKGRLTCRTANKTIVKMQFGRVDIKFKVNWVQDPKHPDNPTKKIKVTSDQPLDIGNDLKAAATDALKKCASELGIAADVYAPNEYKEIHFKEPTSNEEKLTEIKLLLDVEGLTITEEDRMNIERIVEQKEEISYNKCLKLLNANLPKIS
jgi:hypothetical protein